jgi:hypothetical protein
VTDETSIAGGVDGEGWSTIERRASTHEGELYSQRPSETSHSPGRPAYQDGVLATPATENATYHNLPKKFLSNGWQQKGRYSTRTTCDEFDPCHLGHAHAELELYEGETDNERRGGGGRATTTAAAGLGHQDGVDGVGASEEDPVGARAGRKSVVALPEAAEEGIVRDGHAREAGVRDALGAQRDRGVEDREDERVRVAGGGRVVRLDGRRRPLQDRPVDGEVALHEGLLEQRGEVEAVVAARIGAVAEHGVPLVLAGACLREEVAQEALGCAADLLRRFGEAEDGGREPPRGGRCLCASIWMTLRKGCPRG